MNAPVNLDIFDESGNEVVNQLPLSVYNPLEALIGEYELLKKQLEYISETAKRDSAAFSHFLWGNRGNGIASFNVESIFDIKGGMRSLDATYWSMAMSLTKTMDVFAAEKRNEWNEMINKMTTPPFEREMVTSTLLDLMLNREQFFAEKVDGAHRKLSRHHATNSRFGFTDRMIIEYCLDRYGYLQHTQMNYVSDLRACIAHLRGEEAASSYTTYSDVDRIINAKKFGEWFDFDGGAFRLRIYKKGTVHVEIHPDMSWKLNKVLATLHPAAIPSELREPPKRKFKEFVLHDDVIGMDVRKGINDLIRRHHKMDKDHCISLYEFNSFKEDKVLLGKVESIMIYLGGYKNTANHEWVFDFNIDPVLSEIVRTGVVPNSVSYQYYPTPEALSVKVHDLAEIEEHHTILEPSAGMGGLLSQVFNKSLVTCVDVSMTHCFILKEMGFTNVIQGDFLALDNLGKFDRVLMNPPFSEGRAESHLNHAFEQLKVGGVLVAVLPAIMHNKQMLKNANCEFNKIADAGFEGTKVNVTLLKATKLA